MRTDALHELRPRSAVELYDAALHLCVHTRSELPALALLGAAPLAASGIWLAWLVSRGEDFALPALVVALALVFRQLCQGAAGLAATRELEGKPLTASAALRAAASRLPSFVTCTAWLALFQLVLFPVTLGLSIFFLSTQLAGPLLIAEGSAHGWNFGKVARARLQGRGGAAATVRILHAVALLLLVANLHGVMWLALTVVHSLMAVDVSFVSQFASLSHWLYDLCLFAVAQLLLDPVRCAASALLLADARVRHEGFDLLAALQRLRDLPASKVAALLFALVALSPRPAVAQAPAPQQTQVADDEREDPIDALESIADELDERDDPAIDEGLRRADRLPPAERAKLVPLVRSLDHHLDMGQDDAARLELRRALAEAGRVQPARAPGARSVKDDPRAAAQKILAQPEFQDVLKHPKQAKDPGVDAPREPPGWWTRFWKWVGRQLDKLLKSEKDRPVEAPKGGFSITADTAQMITYALIALAACVVLLLVYRLLTKQPADAGAAQAGGGEASGPGSGEELNALAKPSWVWSDEADKLAAQGRFREAIRSLYLALLAALHRRGAIDYHPAQSNWDYCDHFRGEPFELEPFRELTLRFDFGWYGRLGADVEGYSRFKSLCGPLLQKPAASEAARA